jgi:hypothetical protein
LTTDATRAFINTCATTQKGETSVSKSSITRSITVLFVLIASVALVCADLIVSAQNSNQSDETTRGGMMTSQNTNMSSTGGHKRRGRRRRSKGSNANTTGDMTGDTSGNANMAGDTSTTTADTQNTNMGGEMGNANMTGATGGRHRRGRRRGRAAAAASDTSGAMQTTTTDSADGGVQTDLGGQSYTGTASYPDGGVNGTATLEFQSGNQFSLTPEGGTAVSGRYSAVTTRGYTGVTMMFTGTPATIVSVRLKKMGNGVTVMSVPGENHQFSFKSSGGTGGHGKRRPRGKRGRRGGGRTRGMGDMGGGGNGIKPPMANPTPTP